MAWTGATRRFLTPCLSANNLLCSATRPLQKYGRFRACGVATADIDDLAHRIDGDGLRLQRQDFGAATFAAQPRMRRRSPFT